MYKHGEHDWHKLVAQLSLKGRHEASLYIWMPAMMQREGSLSPPHFFTCAESQQKYVQGCYRRLQQSKHIVLNSLLPQTLVRLPKQFSSWANRLQLSKQEGQRGLSSVRKLKIGRERYFPAMAGYTDWAEMASWTMSHVYPAYDSEMASSSSPAFGDSNSQRKLIWNFLQKWTSWISTVSILQRKKNLPSRGSYCYAQRASVPKQPAVF